MRRHKNVLFSWKILRIWALFLFFQRHSRRWIRLLDFVFFSLDSFSAEKFEVMLIWCIEEILTVNFETELLQEAARWCWIYKFEANRRYNTIAQMNNTSCETTREDLSLNTFYCIVKLLESL